jgi:N-acylglucosamine 2-epimerase
MGPNKIDISSLRQEFETELFDRVLPFWQKNSPDKKNGGLYNCLDRDGHVYDTTKHSWLQARQVWMFSTLYNEVEQNPEWLQIARSGFDFLKHHAKRDDNRIHFSLTEKGAPIYLQRKIFSECFYTIALAQYAKATGESAYEKEAVEMFETVWDLAYTPGKSGRPILDGEDVAQTLAVPMILLNVIEELCGDDYELYRDRIEMCLKNVDRHLLNGKIYENISKSGDQKSTAVVRLMNPGHAIEAGWFLQHWALRLKDDDLKQRSAQIIRDSFDHGWDEKFGGLFYFLDAEGLAPTQLEWDMKLWWPHTEAIYSFLLNYATFGESSDWQKFLQVKEYAFDHFSDPDHGEWFGYLNRRGDVTHQFKGGPYKGCFHVPRALYYCWKVLSTIEENIT